MIVSDGPASPDLDRPVGPRSGRLPGIVLRRGSEARKDLVQLGEDGILKTQVQSLDSAIQLIGGDRAHDRAGDPRPRKDPCQSNLLGRRT
jgi:hypothetical protein